MTSDVTPSTPRTVDDLRRPHAQHDEPRSLDDLVRPGDVAMLTTRSASGAMTSRPLTVAEVHGGVMAFLVDGDATWFVDVVDATAAACAGSADGSSREVHVTVQTGRNEWISIRGRPAIGTDRATIERLWSPIASTYLSGRDDPAVRALQVSVIDGEYWSAPGTGALGRLAAVVGAALGRDTSDGASAAPTATAAHGASHGASHGTSHGTSHGEVRRD